MTEGFSRARSGSGSPDDRSHEAKLKRILDRLSVREREALYRFYVLKQSTARISRESGMTEGDLRELKARVKGEFTAVRRMP